MNKILVILVYATIFLGCSQSKKELYHLTDGFVESLGTTYGSYGLNGLKHTKTTENGLYKVTPMGRLINVKILKVVENDVYDNLKEDLKSHYRNDKRVNNVYLNKGGTIMIDCRN